MPTHPPIPTLEEVRRITNIDDPVIRNLQITQSYHELAAVLAAWTGPLANWCTFATWASKQAGQTIRKEDLARLLENRFRASADVRQASERVAASAPPAAPGARGNAQELNVSAEAFTPAVERASAAVARGNNKVFAEIGYEFARFYQDCFAGGAFHPENVDRFCEELHPGEPPAGQEYLRRAFQHYAQALETDDAKARAEWMLMANLEIGLHEQTRLQPEIAESLDVGLVNTIWLTRLVLSRLFPTGGWFTLANHYLRRLLGRPTAFDSALQSLLTSTRLLLHHTITEVMMTITLPTGRRLRLGRDLEAPYPDSLRQISNPELRQLLAKIDPTPDSVGDSGVLDWADLPDRLHFIVELFRCYQEDGQLFLPPFTPEQIAALRGGILPPGRL